MLHVEKECKAEVEGLHQFFVDWMTGAVPRSEKTFERFTRIIAEGLVIVSPNGFVTEQESLVVELEAAYSVQDDPKKDFQIRIENFKFHRNEGDISLVTYEEWQQISGAVTGRLSTALFRSSIGNPNGVEWLHVHET